MRYLLFCSAMLVLAFSAISSARADDLCVRYRVTEHNNNGHTTDYLGTNVPGESNTISVKCVGWLHVPTAAEITSAIAGQIKDAIIAAMQSAVADALKKIADENASREKKIYEQLAKSEERTNAQIKLLIELVKSNSGSSAGAPTKPATDDRSR